MKLDKKVILMIDDNKDFCQLVKINLEQFTDFRIITISNSKEGVETAGQIKPDLILLDLVMPGMDGFEVLECLKKNPKTMNIPVIMMTVNDEQSYRLKAFKLDSDDYITKPVGVDELKIRINAALWGNEKKEKS